MVTGYFSYSDISSGRTRSTGRFFFLKGSSLLLPSLSTCACSCLSPLSHPFFFLNTSFHPRKSTPTHLFYFFVSQSLRSTLYSIPPFVSLASWSHCHPFFLIRLFVPCVLLPGVSSSVSLSVRSGNWLL